MELNFKPFPNLSSNRLNLRQITLEDENEMFFLRSDPQVLEYIKRPPVKTMEEIHDFIRTITESIEKNESIIWGITLKDSPKLIGNLLLWHFRKQHFRAELGYMLHPDYHQKGIMNEAVGLVLDYGFNKLGLHTIEALVDPGNTASMRLLEKNNFVREGYFKEDFYFDGQFLDTALFSLIDRNWKP